MKKILMVCLGNICRSPLAEGILQHKIDQAKLDWQVHSAGTGSWHIGKKPHNGSIAIAKEHGIDISHQRAQQFQAQDLDTYDYIFAMDASNYRDIISLTSHEAQKKKVKLLLNESYPGQNRGVPDPYWNEDGFGEVYRLIEAACTQIIQNYQDS